MINIAELLKDVPKGMKLYSPIIGEVEFTEVINTSSMPIRVEGQGFRLSFDAYGRYMGNDYPDSECLLFPSKDCRTWEKWKVNTCQFKVLDWIVRNNGSSYVPTQIYGLKKDRYLVTNILGSKGELMINKQDEWRLWTIADAKDGDVLVSETDNPFIYNGNIEFSFVGAYVGVSRDGRIRLDMFPSKAWASIKGIKPATKEQRDLLFQKIKEIGYEWDKKKKELHKIIKPGFKVGDWVVGKNGEPFSSGNYAEQITLIEEDKEGRLIWLSSKSWVDDDYIRLWTIEDAKPGDVLVDKATNTIGIFKEINKTHWYSKIYCGNTTWGSVFPNGGLHKIEGTKPATQEQRELLFAKLKDAGYEWDDKKEEWRKIKPHYDVSNFHAGMPVLVRIRDEHKWCYVLFSHRYIHQGILHFHAGGAGWRQCIPFNEDTKHLVGTTDMCDECYINW